MCDKLPFDLADELVVEVDEAVSQRGARPFRLDGSEALLELARERVPDAELRTGDIESLPYESDRFDLMCGFNSFFFANDIIAAVREAGRVAKPGAPVVIQVWGPHDQNELEAMKESLGRSCRPARPTRHPSPTTPSLAWSRTSPPGRPAALCGRCVRWLVRSGGSRGVRSSDLRDARACGAARLRGRVGAEGQSTREDLAMICTLTARRLKPGAFDAFRDAFEKSGVEDVPEEIAKRWSRVYVCRDVTDENVALTFGFFEGTLEELRDIQSQLEGGPRNETGPIAPHIESILLDGSYEVLEEITP